MWKRTGLRSVLGGTVACVWVEFLFATFSVGWPFSQRSRAYNSKASFTKSWAGKEQIALPIQNCADVWYGFSMPQRYSSEDASWNTSCSLSTCKDSRSQRPHALRRTSAAAGLLGLRVRILLNIWLSWVSLLSGRGLCGGLIARPEDAYRLCGWVWYSKLKNEEAMTRVGESSFNARITFLEIAAPSETT